MHNLLERVMKEPLRLTLTTLVLTKGEDTFQGTGYIVWSTEGISLHAVTSGGNARNKMFGMFPLLTPGMLIPANEYLSLKGQTQDGWEITCTRLSDSGSSAFLGSDVLEWTLDESAFLSHIAMQKPCRNPALNHFIADVLVYSPKFRVWPRSTQTIVKNESFGSESFVNDWLKYDVGKFAVSVRQLSEEFSQIRIMGNETEQLPAVIQAVCSALSFISGTEITSVAHSVSDHSQTINWLRTHSRASKRGGYLSPYDRNGTLMAHCLEPMLKSVTDYFITQDGKEVADLLHSCIDSADSNATTHALVLSAVIEALAGRYAAQLSKSSKRAKINLETIKTTLTECLSDKVEDPKLIDRVLGAISGFNSPSASDNLYAIKDSSWAGINEAEIDAWKQTRNKVMHGKSTFGGYTPAKVQNAVTRHNLMANLINKLILSAAGLRGVYFDYGIWDLKELQSDILTGEQAAPSEES